jgi:hypothetical protein
MMTKHTILQCFRVYKNGLKDTVVSDIFIFSFKYNISYMTVFEFKTLDNGGEPFLVRITKAKIDVFKPKKPDAEPIVYDKLIVSFDDYKRVFVGKDPEDRDNLGNSILVQVKDKEYVFIGDTIFSFRIEDKIVDYVSPVGNSAVPYPYAVGTKNTYLMIEDTFIPNDTMKGHDDPYVFLYRGLGEKGLTVQQNNKLYNKHKQTHKLKKRMIHKRLW